LQPVDAPRDEEVLRKIFRQMDCDDLLVFSSDYPHWQFDGDEALPDGLPHQLIEKILFDNPRDAFPRLDAETAATIQLAGSHS